LITEGEGGDRGIGSLLESLGIVVGFDCTILWGYVGVRKPCSPTNQGRRKETLDKSLAVQLKLGGTSMGGSRLALDPYRVGPSITRRMRGQMIGLVPPISLR
jgi:hypothetical protein